MRAITLVVCGIFGLLTLTTLQGQDPTLLGEAPEGWRFERIEFPLDFAPDLELEGYEELWFSPGMFDANADSYFSYAIAMEFEHGKELEAEFVRNLFQTYFVGLCKSVGGARNLDLDLDEISTKAKVTDQGIQVTVNMYDPFVTGKKMKLNIRVTSHPAKDDSKIILLGTASPADADAEIWETLETFRTGFGK